MKNIEVSIIVPVYNAENYLEKCLNSLINQSLEDIEIICVDDQSTDASLSILDAYAKKDSRIKVFSKKHGGAGAARNLGLINSKGKYILFADSDDWINLKSCEYLYKCAENKKTDIIMFKLINYDDKYDSFYEDDYYNILPLKDFFEGELFFHKNIKDNLFRVAVSTANKFYNRNFLVKIGVKFPEGVMFEDNPFFSNVY